MAAHLNRRRAVLRKPVDMQADQTECSGGELEIERNYGSNASMTSTPVRRRRPRLLRIIRMRPRLFVSAGVSLIAIALLFAVCREWGATTKLLIGWDLGLTLYLALA